MTANFQADKWRGDFGDDYTQRNPATEEVHAARIAMWRRILEPLGKWPESIVEVGANVGINIKALSALTDAVLHAVEPNDSAREALIASGHIQADRVYDATAS